MALSLAQIASFPKHGSADARRSREVRPYNVKRQLQLERLYDVGINI